MVDFRLSHVDVVFRDLQAGVEADVPTSTVGLRISKFTVQSVLACVK